MRRAMVLVLLAGMVVPVRSSLADDADRVRKAVEKSTLDQPGTKPFHLKAVIVPRRADAPDAREKSATVEIWWESPTKWRREIKSPVFSQVEIVDGDKDWQKNDGDFFPEWLRESAVALVRPVPDLEQVLEQVRGAETRQLFGATHYSWRSMGSDGTVSKAIGAGIDLRADGFLQGGSGLGWSAYFSAPAGSKDPFYEFHGRQVGRHVDVEDVVATVTVLEDLKHAAPELFAMTGAGDPHIQTVVVEELAERKNLEPIAAPVWPPIEKGPLAGAMLAEVVIDRSGKIRTVGSVLSDNPGLNGVAGDYMRQMEFKPTLLNGQPVQVVTTITMGFKTTRPPGMETFASSDSYLNRARQVGYPTEKVGAPYVLQAEFEASGVSGEVSKGTYTDTWLNDNEWRREANFEGSRLVRSRDGEKRYLLSEGADAKLLGMVFRFLEPIPATSDGWFDAEWGVKHEAVDGVTALRVSRGPENPDGTINGEAYWVGDDGRLLKVRTQGVDVVFKNFEDFGGRPIARLILVRKGDKLVMRVKVTSVATPAGVDPAMFAVKGHEWTRQFTQELR